MTLKQSWQLDANYPAVVDDLPTVNPGMIHRRGSAQQRRGDRIVKTTRILDSIKRDRYQIGCLADLERADIRATKHFSTPAGCNTKGLAHRHDVATSHTWRRAQSGRAAKPVSGFGQQMTRVVRSGAVNPDSYPHTRIAVGLNRGDARRQPHVG